MAATTQGPLSRGIVVIEALVGRPDGLTLAEIADHADLPKSATHRILATLIESGWVAQSGRNGNYALTLAVVSAGLRHLSATTLTTLAMPTLERLAAASGQLVRLALADGERLIWVARYQGARSGLRYDPDVDHGQEIPLGTTATGLAWLSALPRDEALRIALTQAAPKRHEEGPGIPSSSTQLTDAIVRAEERGWAEVHDANELGISAMAKAIVDPATGVPLGAVSVAGPSVQLSSEKMTSLVPDLEQAVVQLSGIAAGMAGELARST